MLNLYVDIVCCKEIFKLGPLIQLLLRKKYFFFFSDLGWDCDQAYWQWSLWLWEYRCYPWWGMPRARASLYLSVHLGCCDKTLMRSNLGEERDYLSFGFTIYYKGKPSQEPGVKNGSRDHRGILLTNLILMACTTWYCPPCSVLYQSLIEKIFPQTFPQVNLMEAVLELKFDPPRWL